jgi:hypothetical protein
MNMQKEYWMVKKDCVLFDKKNEMYTFNKGMTISNNEYHETCLFTMEYCGYLVRLNYIPASDLI